MTGFQFWGAMGVLLVVAVLLIGLLSFRSTQIDRFDVGDGVVCYSRGGVSTTLSCVRGAP